MEEYAIIIEKAGNNFAAMVPDLPSLVGRILRTSRSVPNGRMCAATESRDD